MAGAFEVDGYIEITVSREPEKRGGREVDRI
jgi:hypothetical protein